MTATVRLCSPLPSAFFAVAAKLKKSSKTSSIRCGVQPGDAINAGLIESGSYTMGSLAVASVGTNSDLKTVEVTLEPPGGSRQPTGPRVLVAAI